MDGGTYNLCLIVSVILYHVQFSMPKIFSPSARRTLEVIMFVRREEGLLFSNEGRANEQVMTLLNLEDQTWDQPPVHEGCERKEKGACDTECLIRGHLSEER